MPLLKTRVISFALVNINDLRLMIKLENEIIKSVLILAEVDTYRTNEMKIKAFHILNYQVNAMVHFSDLI